MSAPPDHDDVRRRLYRSGWAIVVFAICAYLLVAYAEQGSAGAGLRTVPNDPLPFDRHSGIGIDLSAMSSLEALEWLEQADVGSVPLVLVPIDGDIVAAFNNPETYLAARTAVDQLMRETNGATTAACLRRPISAIDEEILAEAIVTALLESYTDRITYVGVCTQTSTTSWEASVLGVIGFDAPSSSGEHILAPMSLGAPLRLQEPVHISDMTGPYFDGLSGSDYVVVRAPAALLDQEARSDAATILHDRSHIASILAAPDGETIPQDFVQLTSLAGMQRTELSEGFNNATSPLISWNGAWTPTDVGPVVYQRTQETGSWMSAEFIGTEIWAVGIFAPDGGRLGIWVDADDVSAGGDPDRIVELSRSQARDGSFLLMDGLPAARHVITVVAADGEVMLSGLFVAGRPEAGWHGVVGSVGLILTAVAGLGVVLTLAVDDLRSRIGLDRPDIADDDHPRVFRRDV